MSQTALHHFLETIMKIDAGYAGMGSAGAGIIGATGTQDQVLTTLKTEVMSFANLYVQTTASTTDLRAVAGCVEGSIYALKLTNTISDDKLQALTQELKALLNKH